MTLTNLTPPQILPPGSKRPINIMILPDKPPLSPIPQSIELIAPMPAEPPPSHGCVGCVGCGLQRGTHVGDGEVGGAEAGVEGGFEGVGVCG